MNDESLVPELRFSEFKNKWIKTKLGEVAEIKSGGTPNRGKIEYWNGKIPWVTTSLLNKDEIWTTEEFITKDGLDNSSAKLFSVGTILMAMYGQGKTRGMVSNLRIEASTNQACAALILDDTVDNEFVFQSLKNDYERIRNLSNDGGQKNLSSGLIRTLKFVFPTLPEQKKIASFLTAIDKRIKFLEEKKTKLEQYKKGVMQQLFNQDIRFKDGDGNAFPDWEEKRLGEIGKTLNGLTGKTKVDFGEGKPYIQYMQVFRNSKIDVSEFDFVNIEDNEKQTQFQYGDVFFTTSSETPNEIGMASVLMDEVEELYLNSFCFGYRPNSLNELVPEFSQYFFRSDIVRREIIKLAQGSTRFNMSKLSLLKFKFFIPQKEEQKKIADFLMTIDSAIERTRIQIDGSSKFKKGLLQKMFV